MNYRNERYKQIYQHFRRWCNDQELKETIGNELLWLESLKDQGLSASTIRTYGWAVKSCIIDNLESEGMTSEQRAFEEYKINFEFRSFKMPRTRNRQKKETIDQYSLEKILSKVYSKKKTVIIEFLACTGCRVSEMTAVRLNHVRKVTDSEYRIRILGKGSIERTVKINGGLRKRISQAYPNTVTFLFESSKGVSYSRKRIYEIVREAGDKIGLERLHPHSLRHFFATTMIDKTGDIDAVSHYLGHADVATTLAMYYHGKPLTMEQLSLNLYGNRGKKRSSVNAL